MRLFRFVPILLFAVAPLGAYSREPSPAGWEKIRPIRMSGGLRAFWDVGGAPLHEAEALERGFAPVQIIGDYSDYPGKQARNIGDYLKQKQPANNPWDRPEYFEEIVRQNIRGLVDRPGLRADDTSLFVHDIEFGFEQDIAKAWEDAEVRAASGARDLADFEEAYLAEWAKWFWLPCEWGKEALPGLPAGLYGPQPFRRDYWGIAGKDAGQIDGTHALDDRLWRHIDPHVDFYIASVYVFYDDPGSIFYIASNIEENFLRTRPYGDKPVYAYSWLRYHDSNKKIGGQELATWLADGAAAIPYFFGARGNVLWGWEPRTKEAKLYGNLAIYTDSLGRVADLSEKIARAQPEPDDPPAHVMWKEKRPLLKRLKVAVGEWIVLAANPWQAEDVRSELEITCGRRRFTMELQGRHTDIFHISGGKATRLQVDYSRAAEPAVPHAR